MDADTIHQYCNGVLGINRIKAAMRSGEIKRCKELGSSNNPKLIAQKRYVDEWLDKVFESDKPTKLATMLCIPVNYHNQVLQIV